MARWWHWALLVLAVLALVLQLLARDPARRGGWFSTLHLTALTMITVTGIVYAVILAAIWKPEGWYRVADQTLHYAVPIGFVLGYLLFGPRPFITYADGGVTRRFYPYHFIDVDVLGYGPVLANIAGVVVLMLAVGALFWLLDRKLPARL
ncbi:MAG: Pr6Pr family membrane protein [Micromonosporaceae bacterium]